MVLPNRTTPARQNTTQQVNYLRKTIVFGDDDVEKEVGVLPAGAQILRAISGVEVNEAFDAGTSNGLDIGTTADPNLYGTLLALGAIAFVPLDEAVSMKVAAKTTITATPALTGTAATAGEAEVVIAFIPDNDG